MIDGSIKACGVGVGKDENEARSKAFDNAKAEFDRICNSTDSCKGHATTSNPKRTTCEEKDNQFKCYRMVEFSISLTELKSKDKNQLTISKSQVLKKGMKKTDIKLILGAPEEVIPEVRMPHVGVWGTQGTVFLYKGKVCNHNGFKVPMCNLDCYGNLEYIHQDECVIGFDDDEAIYIYNFKPALMEDLN